jgi:hypothetical protein
MAKCGADRMAEMRRRKAFAGLHEVRGIWAPKKHHVAIRLHVSAALPKPADPDATQQAFTALEEALKTWFRR